MGIVIAYCIVGDYSTGCRIVRRQSFIVFHMIYLGTLEQRRHERRIFVKVGMLSVNICQLYRDQILHLFRRK